MAQTIKLKRSATANQKPTTAQVEFGEVAINTTDERVYTNGSATGIFELVSAAISQNAAGGDVLTFNGNPSEYVFPGTGTLNIPVGTTIQRPTDPSTGDIRFNTDTQSFEGYDAAAGAWGSLGGVKDVDQDTYVTTESSPTADEDTFSFYGGQSQAVSGTLTGTDTLLGTWSRSGFNINTATTFQGAATFNGDINLPAGYDATLGEDLTVKGNTILGDAATDTLTVGATSTFNSPVTIANGKAFTANGNTTIGNAAADTLTVNATSTFNNGVTLGSSTADALTVKSTSTFDGPATFNGNVTIQSGDTFTFDGNAFNNAHKFTIKNAAGTITFGGWVFDTDTNSAN